MRKILLVLVCLSFVAEMSAQQVIKSSNIEAFSSITLSGKLTVDLIPAESNAIEVNLYESEITKFKWTVSNQELSMSLRPSGNGAGRADVKIYYKAINALYVSSAEVSSKEVVTADLFTLKVSSSGIVTLKFNSKDIEVMASSNSVALLSGYSKYLTLNSSEKSKLEARALDCVSAVATATSGGEIYVCAQERLEAYAKTGSTIFYKGDPTILKVPTSKFMGLGASVHNIGK